jgi:hypothetical protein
VSRTSTVGCGEPDALVKSFAGVPELNDPVRGCVKGVRAFEAFLSEASLWLHRHSVSVEALLLRVSRN